MSTEAALKAKWNAYYSNAMDRFWSRVDQSGGPDACWPWTGCTKPGGYGFIMHKRRARLTHRVALSGSLDVQPGMMACHSCDNPICCNPAHLFWGTAQDNSDDCAAKGRKRGAPRIIDVDELVRRRDGGASYSVLAVFFRRQPVKHCEGDKAPRHPPRQARQVRSQRRSEQKTQGTGGVNG